MAFWRIKWFSYLYGGSTHWSRRNLSNYQFIFAFFCIFFYQCSIFYHSSMIDQNVYRYLRDIYGRWNVYRKNEAFMYLVAYRNIINQKVGISVFLKYQSNLLISTTEVTHFQIIKPTNFVTQIKGVSKNLSSYQLIHDQLCMWYVFQPVAIQQR